ncbi:MAG: HAMP domain-containing sensor histidine kinase [Actinomycetota bacterium]|nr:HAMP domain-containing sensor histidine kinase [Actinomycetota bacterium]
MTRRLLLSYLGLAVLILLILEVPLATLAQRFERQLATNQAEKDASGLVALVGQSLDDSKKVQLQATVASYEEHTGGEVVLVAASGAVLASSSSEAHHDWQGEWHPLVEKALSGQTVSVFTEDEDAAFAVAAVPVVVDGHDAAAVVLGAPAALTERRIHQIWLALALIAAGAVLVAVLAGVVLARSLALPLGRLEATVDRFARGNLASRAAEEAGPAEIRSLARQFNHMAAQLDELIEGQKRFVADASHQLRSPLTALRLRLENLGATADPASQDSIAAVGGEVQRLSRLVDGLLALSRAGQEVIAPVPVDVAAVMAERSEAWSALAAEKDLRLELQDDRPGGWRRPLQPGDLEQILDNLLANAVEVSPPGATIVMALRRTGRGAVEVHVTDEGPGLAEEDRRRAFDRFWQAPSRPSGHSGLGLAVVRQLSHRNGLEVELRAVAPHGLDAVVLLPAPR